MRPRFRFEHAVAVVLLLTAVCALYPELVFQDRVFFAGDNQAAFSFGAAVERGLDDNARYPLWNPFLFSGMPSYGSLSYTPGVYPLSWLFKLLVRFFFFPRYIWLLFHTFLVGFGTYLLLREREVWAGPAIAAGVLMMWMPNLVAVGANGHGSQACAVAYLPLALLFWDRLWRGKGVLTNGSALAIVLGLSMLRGHLQVSYYTYMLVAMHLAFFGTMRFIDAAKSRSPENSVLPRRWIRRLTAGDGRYTAGTAAADVGWAVVVLGIVVGVSLLISAVLYLPVHDYAQYSIRGASDAGGLDYRYATSWSLHPSETLTFILPFAFGFGKDLYFGQMPFTDYPNYLGLVLAAGAIAAVFLVRSRFVWFLAVVSLLTTVISFGKFLPVLYDPLFRWLPYFDKFRVPVMILIVQQLCMAALFGIGLQAILNANMDKGKRAAVVGLACAFVLFMVVMLSQGFWGGAFAESIAEKVRSGRNPQEKLMVARVVGNYVFRDLIRFAIVLAAVIVPLYAYFNRRLNALTCAAIVLVVGMVDVYLVDRNILHPEEFRHHESLRILHDRSVIDSYRRPDSLISFLQKDSRHYRVFPLDHPKQPFSALFASNRFMNFGISSIGGYHPAKLSVYDEFFRAFGTALSRGDWQLVDLLNVRYVISRVRLTEGEHLHLVWSGADYRGEQRFVHENPLAFSRVFLVDEYRVAAGKDEALRLLASGRVDLSRTAILGAEPTVKPLKADGGEVGAARIVSFGYNRIEIQARCGRPAILVLGEVYYPDWRVEVDGNAMPLLKADYVLRGVALDAGDHRVVFHYDGSGVRRAAVVSSVSFGAAVLFLLVGFVISKRGGEGENPDHNSDI